MLLLAYGFHSPWLTAWFWITLVIALVWLRRHLDVNRGRSEPLLSEQDADAQEADLPSLSVLVAAKDEEANIGRCVEGLLAQDYPDLQIIVIDDRSADATGEIIDRLAFRAARLLAVHVSELPAGWFGKNNAMRLGVERATGQLLCFSDADCTYDSRKLLRAAVCFARRERVEFLSVLPRLEAHTFWERVVQPAAGAIMVFWFPPQKVNDPRSACAYANGAFMLMSRHAYETIGGHEYAKATLNEDMHMARQAKRKGVRLRVLQGGGLYRVRMYTGLRQIWRGWSRIFYGCFGTFPRLLVSVIMLSIFSLSPYVSFVAAALAGGSGWWIAGAAAAAIAAQQSILARFYRLSGNAPGMSVTYPIGATICLGMTLNAMTRLGGKTTKWRGTVYQGGAQTGHEASEAAAGGADHLQVTVDK
jgi:cellulose synthase/poly-beta-1,6-N-acetylglucosamine synthase-like glycosyltransferase